MTKVNNNDLRISEIFTSLQGEGPFMGLPTTFIRLTGCPLRCDYCDTEYAFNGGERMTQSNIIQKAREAGAQQVCVTGGEPLAQPACFDLLTSLCDEFSVSLETSGALSIAQCDERVLKVMDIKTPGSGEVGRNLWENLDSLSERDAIKFIICDYNDYTWAKNIYSTYDLKNCATCWLSPSYNQCSPKELAEWILQDRWDVRMQLQMHKLIWGDVPGV